MVIHYTKKHKIIKTHNTHKGLVSIIFLFLFLIGFGLYAKILTVDEIPDANYKVLSLGLLFSMNLILIILTIVFIVFYIEVKDEYLEK
ncbi:hypothetical protein JXB41_01000 [Candidatus Woesearchaeota archaeon]|nr:hypothetical protein [Candidatus Woesearchaeota archaeon]